MVHGGGMGDGKDEKDRMRRSESMATRKSTGEAGQPRAPDQYVPPYGDLTALNTSRLILDSAGPALLSDAVGDFLDLLGTSCAIYEKNGDYALGILSSNWCRFMDLASRRRCGTRDNRKALASGTWHCHESCWNEACRPSIETGEPVDVECRGGIRLFAVPIRAGNEIVGSISVGYGDPPRDPSRLRELAATYGVTAEELHERAEAYETRPSFVIELAKKRLLASARLIGEVLERRRAEEALRESEEKYKSLVEATSTGYVIVDSQGRVMDANQEYVRLTGHLRLEEILGRSVVEWTAKHDRDRNAEEVRKCAERGFVRNLEIDYSNKEGLITPVEIDAAVSRTLGAQRIVGVCRDITERRRAEGALRESNLRLNAILNNIPDMAWLKDGESRFIAVNEPFGKACGVAPGDLVGKTDIDIWPEDLARHYRADDREVMVTEKRKRVEERLVDAAGNEHWIETIKTPIFDSRGEVVGTTGIARDITERRQAEEALRQANLVVENSPVVLFRWKAAEGWPVELVSRNVVQFGYLPEELLSGAVPYSALVHPDDLDRVAREVREHSDRGAADFHQEYRIITKDGEVRWLDDRTVVERGADGRPTHYQGIVIDITERKRAEEERRKLEGKMREVQRLESLGVLAGGIAHEFNNLLTAIMGNTDLALLSLSPGSSPRHNIEAIARASQRAADLCHQMLAYSGKGLFMVHRYNLSEIVREMAQMLEVSVSKKASLRYCLADELPAVEADATQMRQVIMGLITNASEALGDAGGVISVSTGVMECDRAYLSETYVDDGLPEGRYVYLAVSDTGCGMDAETLGRIFDPFFTTKFMGRGLGLAAVLGIVRAHKGAIHVDSEPGKGATFKILLPAVERMPKDWARIAAQSAQLLGGGTVLLIEDEEHVREVGAEILGWLGFQVLIAANGREGLEVFGEHGSEIDCVILDLTMPEMGGEETLRELRRLRSDVNLILASGYDEKEVTQRFAGKGLAGFIQKPYTMATLRETLKRVLG